MKLRVNGNVVGGKVPYTGTCGTGYRMCGSVTGLLCGTNKTVEARRITVYNSNHRVSECPSFVGIGSPTPSPSSNKCVSPLGPKGRGRQHFRAGKGDPIRTTTESLAL
jgi:hypothetical protein